MLRLLAIPLALFVLLLGAMAWSGSASVKRADFTYCNASGRDIITLDTNQMSYLQDFRVTYATREGLYDYDGETLTPIPGIATHFDVSADKKVYTFHLRPEAKWNNNDPCVAGDFVFAWRRMLESPGEYSYLFYYIKGAEKYEKDYQDYLSSSGSKPDFGAVGIEAVDPHTLRVSLENPVAFILDLLAFPPFFPLHEPSMRPFATTDAKGHVTYDGKFTRPEYVVTNGPFNLTAWDFKRRVRMEKNPTYWDIKNVKSNSIEMQVVEDSLGQILRYEAGELDWVSEVPSEVAPEMFRKHRPDLRNFGGFGTYFLSLMVKPTFKNGQPNPLSNIKVRQALAMAIDRNPIVNNVTRMGEKPATTYVPPDVFPGFKVEPGLGFDPQRARELLKESGYTNGLPGVSLLFRSGVPTSAAIAQTLANQWRANLGVEIPLDQQETKTAKDRIKDKDYAISVANWIGDYPDPSTFTDKYRSTSVNNDSAWINPEFDRLLDDATKEPDPQKRYRILEKANRMIDVEVPVIPLYYLTNQYLFRDDVKGINLNPRNMTMLKGVYVERKGS
jgi:oligopeptide transport system substrate-binding protein